MTDAARAVIVSAPGRTRIEGPVGGPLTFKVSRRADPGRFTALENVTRQARGHRFTRTRTRTNRGS